MLSFSNENTISLRIYILFCLINWSLVWNFNLRFLLKVIARYKKCRAFLNVLHEIQNGKKHILDRILRFPKTFNPFLVFHVKKKKKLRMSMRYAYKVFYILGHLQEAYVMMALSRPSRWIYTYNAWVTVILFDIQIYFFYVLFMNAIH